ncbi:MAG: NTP transferase domain-containing protein [Planctomycetes bacterium]|nr:NTP transferase domain-containing protein [Planctomycetota bacterium]
MNSPAHAPDLHLRTGPLTVILAAGEGSRLARQGEDTPKPALSLLGLSLAERTIVCCMAAGIRRFLVVLGHAADQVQAHYQGIAARRQCDVEFVTAQDWKLGNGASALAAADKVGSDPFLLTMSDHLIAPSLIAKILQAGTQDGEISLAVDRDKTGVFDVEDVTKVALSDGRVVRIGKTLDEWDAADTGVFLCTRALFDALERAQAQGRHSLSDGVSQLAAAGKVSAVDVTGEDWIDVDTPESLREAGRRLLGNLTKGGEDGYVSIYLNRPISTRLSARLVATRITPNQITVISFLISLVGAGFLAAGQYAFGFVGGLLVQSASIIDGCDGEIARLKHMSSARGAWLDTVLDRYADLAVALAITFAYSLAHPGPLPAFVGTVAAFGFILASYVTKEFSIRHERPYPNDILNRLKRRDMRLLLICLGAVAGRPFEALLLTGAISHACVIGILFRGWRMSGPPGFGRAA